MQSIAGCFLISISIDRDAVAAGLFGVAVSVFSFGRATFRCVGIRVRARLARVRAVFGPSVVQALSRNLAMSSQPVHALAAGVVGRCDEVEVAGPLVPSFSVSNFRLCIAGRSAGRARGRARRPAGGGGGGKSD